MSTDGRGPLPGPAQRSLVAVVGTAGVASAVIIGHAIYGARRYEDQALYHVLFPALFWLVLAIVFAGAYAWRPGRLKRWGLVALVGLPYVGIFGVAHGAIGHALKLVFYVGGMAPDRLAELFNLGDYVAPDDAIFEATGVATCVAGLFVGYSLLRFVRATKEEISSAAGSDAPPEAGSPATKEP